MISASASKSNIYGSISSGGPIGDRSSYQGLISVTTANIAIVEISRGAINASMDLDSTSYFAGLYNAGVITGAFVAGFVVRGIAVKRTLVGLNMTLLCSFLIFLSTKNPLLLKCTAFGSGFGSVRYLYYDTYYNILLWANIHG